MTLDEKDCRAGEGGRQALIPARDSGLGLSEADLAVASGASKVCTCLGLCV